MKKLLLALALMMPISAYAGYNISTQNVTDITEMDVGDIASTDLVHVYRTGTATAQMFPLTAIAGYEDLTATETLVPADCGKTLTLNSATEFATTLPSPTAGCKFRFIIKAAPASANYTIVTASSDNVIIGGVNELEVDTGDDGPYDANADIIYFIDGVAVVGDWVQLDSDGTSWYLSGSTNADGGVSLTTID